MYRTSIVFFVYCLLSPYIVYATDYNKPTPRLIISSTTSTNRLHKACWVGNIDAVTALVKKEFLGERIKTQSQKDYPAAIATPLQVTLESPRTALVAKIHIVSLLLNNAEKQRVNITSVINANGNIPLLEAVNVTLNRHQAASELDKNNLFNAVLRHTPQEVIHCRNNNNETVLHAVLKAYRNLVIGPITAVAMVEKVLEISSRRYTPDDTGETPLCIARSMLNKNEYHTKIITALEKYEAEC